MSTVEILALPAVIDLTTASRVLGIGRTSAYQLARQDRFPCPILRIGNAYRIPTAELLQIIGLEPINTLRKTQQSSPYDTTMLTTTEPASQQT